MDGAGLGGDRLEFVKTVDLEGDKCADLAARSWADREIEGGYLRIVKLIRKSNSK